MRYKRSPKQYSNTVIVQQAELQNVNFFTQIISVQLNLPQEKARKSRQVIAILSVKKGFFLSF